MITQGKWKIDGGSNEKGDLFIWPNSEDLGGHAIATVHGEIQEGAGGNAALIAAAPQLLAACEVSLDLLEEIRIRLMRKHSDKGGSHWDEKVLKIQEAIEAAKGV